MFQKHNAYCLTKAFGCWEYSCKCFFKGFYQSFHEYKILMILYNGEQSVDKLKYRSYCDLD